MKHGAWTPCPKCKHVPELPEDKAQHVMTSDHYFSQADLEGISARVQSGQPLHFDPQQVQEFVATMADIQSDTGSLGRFIFGFIAVVVVIVIVIIFSMRFFSQ